MVSISGADKQELPFRTKNLKSVRAKIFVYKIRTTTVYCLYYTLNPLTIF